MQHSIMEMDGNQEINIQRGPIRRPQGHVLSSAIVSGDSEIDEDDERSRDPNGPISSRVHDASEGEEELVRFDRRNPAHADDLYDQNLDEEDEAYVYRHLRGGVRETVAVRRIQKKNTSDDSVENLAESEHVDQQPTSMRVYKPRNSDAVLSCPCCFNIVCMDCQRHQRYPNQFRAMFVMGIEVDWHSRLVYDEDQELLIDKAHDENYIPPDESLDPLENADPVSFRVGEYFRVLCASCQTQVAALDMTEEIYHFHGCLESS